MNTPPHSSISSSSISSLSLFSADYTPASRIVMPPTPPFHGIEGHPADFDGKHKFFIGPPQIDESPQHECHTVMEEEENDETSSSDQEPMTPKRDSYSHVYLQSIAIPGANPKSSTIPTTLPPTPPNATVNGKSNGIPDKNGAPMMRRSSSSRLSSLFRRNSRSELSEPPSPIKSRVSGFFANRKSKSPPASPSPSPSSTSEPEMPSSVLTRPMSQTTLQPAGPQPNGKNRFGRSRRSTSTTSIPALKQQQMSHNDITHPAPQGSGSKSRMLSTVATQMSVQVIPLSSKYASHSHVPFHDKHIGEGATAIVKLVHLNAGPPTAVFAVKEFRKRGRSESQAAYEEKVNSEFCISKSLHHPNIVMTADLCLNKDNRWCHVMEFCSGGDLCTLIGKGYMKDTEKLCCFKQLVRGVAYLHNHGIAHRDIKPENLLMSGDGTLKITDFGVSEVFRGKHPGICGIRCGVDMGDIRLSRPGICGSEPYISPEVFEKKGDYDPRKLDVWSCAMVWFALFYSGTPWGKATLDDPRYIRFTNAYNEWMKDRGVDRVADDSYDFPHARAYSGLKMSMQRLMFRMTHPNPDKRITIQEAMSDRWIQTIECCTLDEGQDHEPGAINAAAKSACRAAGKCGVKKIHNHLPPPPKRSIPGREFK